MTKLENAASALLVMMLFTLSCTELTTPARNTPNRIVIVAGDLQIVAFGVALPVTPQFAVLDAQGTPVRGQPIVFTTNASSHLEGAALTMDSVGRAILSAWEFDAAGPHVLTAKVGDVAKTASAAEEMELEWRSTRKIVHRAVTPEGETGVPRERDAHAPPVLRVA